MTGTSPDHRLAGARPRATPWRRVAVAALTTLTAALTACGGGGAEMRLPAAASAPPTATLAAASTAALTAALATARAGTEVGGQAPRRKALALSDEALGNQRLSELLPYLEQNYGHLLGSDAITQRAGGDTYRCYTPTGNCVGYDNTALFGLGPAVGNLTQPVQLTTLDAFCTNTPLALSSS